MGPDGLGPVSSAVHASSVAPATHSAVRDAGRRVAMMDEAPLIAHDGAIGLRTSRTVLRDNRRVDEEMCRAQCEHHATRAFGDCHTNCLALLKCARDEHEVPTARALTDGGESPCRGELFPYFYLVVTVAAGSLERSRLRRLPGFERAFRDGYAWAAPP